MFKISKTKSEFYSVNVNVKPKFKISKTKRQQALRGWLLVYAFKTSRTKRIWNPPPEVDIG